MFVFTLTSAFTALSFALLKSPHGPVWQWFLSPKPHPLLQGPVIGLVRGPDIDLLLFADCSALMLFTSITKKDRRTAVNIVPSSFIFNIS